MESGSPEPSTADPTTTSDAGTATPVDVPSHREGHLVHVVDDQSVPLDLGRLEALGCHVLRALDVPAELELTITCVDVDRIAELNRAHLDGDGPTDVLAFPIDAPGEVSVGVPGLLGDVVVCPAVAHRQAGGHDRSPTGELDLLVVHGILHLLGHDHAEPAERTEMFALTDALLAAFGGSS